MQLMPWPSRLPTRSSSSPPSPLAWRAQGLEQVTPRPPPQSSGMTRLTHSWPSFTTRLEVSRTYGSWSRLSLSRSRRSRWRDLVLLTLRRYALDDNVLLDDVGTVLTASWLRLDSIVLS